MAYDIRLTKIIQDDQRKRVVLLRKRRTLGRTEQKYENRTHSINGSTSVIQPSIKIDFIQILVINQKGCWINVWNHPVHISTHS